MKKLFLALSILFLSVCANAQSIDTTIVLCDDLSIHLEYQIGGKYETDEVYIDFTELSVVFQKQIEQINGVEKVHANFPGKYSMLVFVGGAFDKKKVVDKIVKTVKYTYCVTDCKGG